MFTSRSEYRLLLRPDNADLRLTRKAYEHGGFISEERMQKLEEKEYQLEKARQSLDGFTCDPHQWGKYGVKVCLDGVKRSASQILAFPHVSAKDMERIWEEAEYEGEIPDPVKELIKTDCLYATQLRLQKQEIDSFRKKQHVTIPEWINYEELPMISNEEKEKLSQAKPTTIYAASRISGVRSATLLLLYQYAMRQKKHTSTQMTSKEAKKKWKTSMA
jgi:tRNA uridine 5-carboxymethylaminomethyl modification enzyme